MSEKGKIRAIQFKNSAIGAGTIAMLKEGNTFKGVVTVTHITPAQEWVILSPFYSGPVTSDMSLNAIVIEDSTKRCFPLVSKQWNGVKQLNQIDSGILVDFDKKPFPFVAGLYSRLCRDCESHFQAGKKQPICESCCEQRTEAVIVSTIEKKVEKTIPVINSKLREISKIAFDAARENKTITFDDWFTQNY